MRYLLLSYAYEPGLTADAGGFRKLWELAAALARGGAEVEVLYPRLPRHRPLRHVPARAYGVVDRRVARPLTAYASMLAAALRTRPRPDVVYFRAGLNVLPVFLRRGLGSRLVLEVNADPLEFMSVEGASDRARRLARWALGVSARASDLVVAVTPGLARRLVEDFRVQRDKVVVIPSATDSEHFAPMEAAAARRQLGLEPERPLVGFVGLFYRHQGVPTLLHALAKLRPGMPRVGALVVGDGAMRAEWQALARALQLEDVVRFTGQVPYASAPAYFNAMDVVVAPFTAHRGETSPFKVLDALACARPVIASDLPSVRPLVESGALRLVPPDDPGALADAIAELLADPVHRVAMGWRGRGYVEQHASWDRAAALLTEALGRG
ncbi:MAG TPA: glycosyltransferase family 4 protein [Methylomirabilota bacterium]|jgi:glycosyltransferase involved in cell wall biosynthesis